MRKEYIYFRLGSPNPILYEDQDPKSSMLGPGPKKYFYIYVMLEKNMSYYASKKGCSTGIPYLNCSVQKVSRTCHLADDFLSYSYFFVYNSVVLSYFLSINVRTSWKPVLRIREIFMRIRTLGSVLLTNGSGCGSGRPENIRIPHWYIYIILQR